MNSKSSNANPQELSKLIAGVVDAVIGQNHQTLNQLLKQLVYDIPAQQPNESLKAQTTKTILIEIASKLENILGSITHPIMAWFVVYVGLVSSPPEAIQSVQMVLDRGFKPFEDFFVDRQGIHFYDLGTSPEKLSRMPERLSEFTQMTVRINITEVHQLMERFDVAETMARQMLLNLKILEQKMNIPLEELLGVLDYNDELKRQVMESDLTKSDKNGFGM
jgi:hypothetical protein